MLFTSLILAAWICSFVYEGIEKNRSENFLRFIADNADALSRGERCVFEGVEYGRETRLVRYEWCISIIIITMTRGTGYHPLDGDKAAFVIPAVITFFGGWWGIPWGPVRSVAAFIGNGKAKDKSITVGELIFMMR
ncbi:MAG: hypothetical protein NC120_02865 [Ruminococcus sp.]|nr:hypothetical protein [Ruminococcus sp.]